MGLGECPHPSTDQSALESGRNGELRPRIYPQSCTIPVYPGINPILSPLCSRSPADRCPQGGRRGDTPRVTSPRALRPRTAGDARPAWLSLSSSP